MPKVKWGVSSDDIESAKDQGFTPYEGPLPPNGVYNFEIKRAQFKTSKNDNPMLKLLLIIEGKDEKAQYDGAPVWDQVVVTNSSAWKVKQFCASIGITAREFENFTVIDDDDNVTKIGSVKFPGAKVKAMTRIGKDQNGADKAEIGQYLPAPEGANSAVSNEPDFTPSVPDAEPQAGTEPSGAEPDATGPTVEEMQSWGMNDLREYATGCGIPEADEKGRDLLVQKIRDAWDNPTVDSPEPVAEAAPAGAPPF